MSSARTGRVGTAGRITLIAGGALIGCASAAPAQEIVTRDGGHAPLIAAIIVAVLLPPAEAVIYRLAAKARFIRSLWLSVVLDLAAYGLAVIWVGFLPGGVNPWFAYIVRGPASGFTVTQAFIAALLFAVAFAAVKVPALIWWLREQGPDRRLTVTVLLTNLVLFFAMSNAVAFIVDALY